MPPMNWDIVVESDLHRVLPFGALRAAMVAVCPHCVYSWWIESFEEAQTSYLSTKQEPAIDPAKKFAHAVLTGRNVKVLAIETAILALNGYWCARENGQAGEKWLILAAQELTAALADTSWKSDRGRFQYHLAEVYRLLGDFASAVKHFDLVDNTARLPKELIEQQRALAFARKRSPAYLTMEQIDLIFLEPAPVKKPPVKGEELFTVPLYVSNVQSIDQRKATLVSPVFTAAGAWG